MNTTNNYLGELIIMTDNMMGTLLIIVSVFFDVLANIFLKKSHGFKYKIYGILAISFVGIAFICLAITITLMDLSIAYALFGAFGLLLTTIIDKLFFSLQIKPLGIIGIFTMILGIILIKIV